MEVQIHRIKGVSIVELSKDASGPLGTDGLLDLLGNTYYQGYDRLIIRLEHLSPDFLDLRTGIAGEALQKFSNYRVLLAIVGDFSGITSNSLHDFIFESNKHKQVNFVPSLSSALAVLSQACSDHKLGIIFN